MVVDNLYLGEASEEVSSAFSFDSEVIEKALRNIYSKEFNAMTDIEMNLFAEFWKKLCEATDIGIAKSNTSYITGDFYHELQHNNAVFAAFKSHRMGKDMSKLLLDSNGILKPFEQWVNDVRPIADHQVYNWFKTEYNTAIHRAHLSADWKQFEAEKDVLPNLEWIESTAVERRLTHVPFYGLVLPIEHEFWNNIKPGDEWGCKCDLSATDTEPTPEDKIPPYGNFKPSKGLENNPAVDGKLFNDTHPYFPSSCKGCSFNKSKSHVSTAMFFGQTKKSCYDCIGVTNALNSTDITIKLKTLHVVNGSNYNTMLQSICEHNSFKPMPNYKGVFWTENESDSDIDNLRNAAKKAIDFGNEVYILPNPKGVRTPDFIFKSKGIYKDYDLKTITGHGSAGTRMMDSIGQTRRVLLNMAVDYNPRKLAQEIKEYFEASRDALEVVIYKGKREIVIKRGRATNSTFEKEFRKEWSKIK